jgi:signal transduction histidine kinase
MNSANGRDGKGLCCGLPALRGAALSDEQLLSGMLRNLIRTAIDHTPSGGSVFDASRRSGAELRISVRDTGSGMRAPRSSAALP